MSAKPSPYTTLSSKTAFENVWLRVREDGITRPDGSEGMYAVVETMDSVLVVAVNEREEILFIKAFRYAANAWAWRLPGGGGVEQEPIQAGMRELAEETGFIASEYHHIGSVRLHGLLREKMHVVVMRSLQQTGETRQSQMGIDGARFQPLSVIDHGIATGKVDDGPTIAAIYMYRCWLAQQANPNPTAPADSSPPSIAPAA